MRINNLIVQAMTALIACFFLLLSVFAFIVPWAHYFRRLTVEPILANPFIMMLAGMSFLSIGLMLLYQLFGGRRKYFKVKGGKRSVTVDETVLRQYAKNYWEQLFPGFDVLMQTTIKSNKIHITADLPAMPFEQQRKMMVKIEKDLAELLKTVLNYNDELFLSVSFRKDNPKK